MIRIKIKTVDVLGPLRLNDTIYTFPSSLDIKWVYTRVRGNRIGYKYYWGENNSLSDGENWCNLNVDIRRFNDGEIVKYCDYVQNTS